MIRRWKELKWWKSGEYQVVQERLKDAGYANINPVKNKIYAALDAVPFERVRVVIAGQDPYPDPSLATGIAFAIPPEVKRQKFPPTLVNFFNEYSSDLSYPFPKSGDLTKWVEQGVLLWNVIPTCESWKSLSHPFVEYEILNEELFKELDQKQSVCFVLLGGRARAFSKFLSEDANVIEASHPSPRGSLSSKTPFLGSRLFSTINASLVERGLQPIDWRLQ